ncbi:lipopolysaccharide biosynthesis protein [Stenotrophomonas sp. TWI1151]|uniref:lipopolysaccharide biosynthesis protein n=1 Tax=Stenotrophomonas sp. TWI1151 TaxID=3136798 RepID=UPI00320AED42
MRLSDNIKWTALAQLSKLCAQFVVVFALARLLPPSEYGVVAIVTIVVNFSLMFRDVGVGAAVIQKRDLLNSDMDAAFRISLSIGAFVAAAVALASPVVSAFFSLPKLIGLLVAVGLSFPLAASSTVHQALLERSGRFRTIARIEVASNIAGAAIGAGSAFAGLGAWSLVAQVITISALSSLQLWHASGWRPSLKAVDGYHSLVSFGSGILGFNLVNYVSRNADSILVGKFYSSAVLGNYSLAYRIMLFPLQSITLVTARSLLPVLSRLQNRPSERLRVYLTAVAGVTFIVAPMMAGLFALRSDFISLFFGRDWTLTSQLLAWFAPTAVLQAVMSTTGVVFMATRETSRLMWLGVLGAVLQVTAFGVGISYGVVLMAKLYLVANVINCVPVAISCMHALGGRALDMLVAALPAVIAAGAMAGVLLVVERVWGPCNGIGELALRAVFGSIIYLMLILVCSRKWRARVGALAGKINV